MVVNTGSVNNLKMKTMKTGKGMVLIVFASFWLFLFQPPIKTTVSPDKLFL